MGLLLFEPTPRYASRKGQRQPHKSNGRRGRRFQAAVEASDATGGSRSSTMVQLLNVLAGEGIHVEFDTVAFRTVENNGQNGQLGRVTLNLRVVDDGYGLVFIEVAEDAASKRHLQERMKKHYGLSVVVITPGVLDAIECDGSHHLHDLIADARIKQADTDSLAEHFRAAIEEAAKATLDARKKGHIKYSEPTAGSSRPAAPSAANTGPAYTSKKGGPTALQQSRRSADMDRRRRKSVMSTPQRLREAVSA